METSERLSERLRAKCESEGLTFQQASEVMGQAPNAVSRWVALSILPGPKQYGVIAEFLGISIFEVGGALALDQVEKVKATRRLRPRQTRRVR